jgi:hypothetical protein
MHAATTKLPSLTFAVPVGRLPVAGVAYYAALTRELPRVDPHTMTGKVVIGEHAAVRRELLAAGVDVANLPRDAH